ncbi:hypothetical protein MIZ01_1188 [Sideroxyarcus emersonii]|uniref:DUF7674 domain-containing protein n=1 Tax=Sideroxyarcus emersonii TaxID=2764705 RepID=A0AAN1X9G8_9PROT|nr:hypothetical protein [Sideroxyarcus emersonii]BCK87410.1 hypothetical protein MIZ01_1188 [Sideroxyarcus emersonii]
MIPFLSSGLPNSSLPIVDGSAQPFEHLLDFKTFASLRRMVSNQKSKPLVKRADFMKQVTLYLPEVAARIEESDFGIVHLEVGAMKLVARDAIVARDHVAIRRYLSLIADLFERADAELYDAIRISFLEALFLGETSIVYMEARHMLSRPMENVLRQAEARLEKSRTATL